MQSVEAAFITLGHHKGLLSRAVQQAFSVLGHHLPAFKDSSHWQVELCMI